MLQTSHNKLRHGINESPPNWNVLNEAKNPDTLLGAHVSFHDRATEQWKVCLCKNFLNGPNNCMTEKTTIQDSFGETSSSKQQ